MTKTKLKKLHDKYERQLFDFGTKFHNPICIFGQNNTRY